MKKFLNLALTVSLVSGGCATIMTGTMDNVKFLSNPRGSTLKVDGMEKGKTPIIVSLGKKTRHHYSILRQSKKIEGYLNKKLSGWFWGNFLCLGGFWICMIVDAATGGMWKLNPDFVSVDFTSANSTVKIESGEIGELKAFVAVLDLEPGKDISPDVAKFLTDILRTYLSDIKGIKLLDRKNMKTILKEQAFQLSECTGSECAIKVGRLLGVEKMFTGSISKLGEKYFLTLQMINVETGEIESAQDLSCDCGESELPSLVKNCAKIMLNKYFNSRSK